MSDPEILSKIEKIVSKKKKQDLPEGVKALLVKSADVEPMDLGDGATALPQPLDGGIDEDDDDDDLLLEQFEEGFIFEAVIDTLFDEVDEAEVRRSIHADHRVLIAALLEVPVFASYDYARYFPRDHVHCYFFQYS